MQHTPTLITSQFGKLLKADAESMPCVRKSAAAGTHLEETRDRVSFTFGEGCVQTQRARRMTGCRGCFGECAAKIRELEAASEIIVIVNIRKILLFLPPSFPPPFPPPPPPHCESGAKWSASLNFVSRQP